MEGVGARLGRSSTRYGPATVFTGPVRRWKKNWIPLLSSNPSNNHGSNSNSNGRSHLLVYKWTPLSASGNGNGSAMAAVTPAKDGAAAAQLEESPRKKFRYVPISVIEEQKQDADAMHEEESKSIDLDQSPQNEQSDMKPDINDVPMDETQAAEKDQAALTEGKGTNLDLSLGLNSEGGKESEPKASQKGEGGSSNPATELQHHAGKSHAENKLKRKAVTPDLEMRV